MADLTEGTDARLARIEEKLDSVLERLDRARVEDRLGALEQWRAGVEGRGSLLGAVWSAAVAGVVSVLVYLFTRGGKS